MTNKPFIAVGTAQIRSRLSFRRAALAAEVIVFCGGINLILVQWVAVREITTLLLGTELVILLVSVSYFLGLSLGYGLVGQVQRRWLIPLALLTLGLHLTLPVWFRLLVAGLDALNAYELAFVLVPLMTVFGVPAFYSIFLPHFVDHESGHLPVLYALELAGAACGVLMLVMLGGPGLVAVMAVYAVGLLAIVLALGAGSRVVTALGGASVVWLLVLPAANRWSNTLWYRQIHQLPAGTETLFTAYSPYQKVDVLETPDGRRYLFLDGLEHFGSHEGSWLNVLLGGIPADLVRPQNALVIGAGSMEMERMIAEYAGHVTTVEIDSVVIEAGRRYFDEYNQMSTLKNRSIVRDDAKHFIANTSDRYQLVATDTPAAFTIQTATLYSQEFFRAISGRLSPGGVVAVNLTSTFAADDTVSRRIAASLLAVYDQVIVVTAESAGWSFAYAGDLLPFGPEIIEARLRDRGETNYQIYDTEAVRKIVGNAQPISLDTMDIVLETSASYIKGRLK